MKAAHIESMVPKLKQLSEYLEGKKFLTGDSISIADFCMHDAIDWHLKLDAGLIEKNSNVKEYLARLKSEPKIKAFLKNDKTFELLFSPEATWNGK